ncbi:uncharacterized protein I303_108605 [Kwoniella dejecticola CBS 10117]|uniref:Wax synthase domain-containing protein n=1 Tax=Kwoniella dejecticola CBS 10117 TaxID=1296121 RepID=A0A1A5ZWX6_9TREE|nr:uncharacterized protein I303_07070 [Kwoniella dejecticola CBS 10117]OBR82311.1 hypothetical protein I303_07070 [Kwoniella dejecticola CBS 10117]
MGYIQIPLYELVSRLPTPHPKNGMDAFIGIGAVHLMILAHLTPHTGGWRLFRMGIVTPLCLAAFGYIVVAQIEKDDLTHWGTCVLMCIYSMRVLEYFVFFPAEENCHRVVPRSQVHPRGTSSSLKIPLSNGHSHSASGGTPTKHTIEKVDEEEVLIAEPVPAPFTWKKLYWSWSLLWSYRGIGWNYQCPLPSESTRHPYSRKSSRLAWGYATIRYYAIGYIIDDFFRSIRNIYGKEFFAGNIPYTNLTQFERGLYSTAVVIRVWFGLIHSWTITAVIFVTIGGVLGWNDEIFAPWGWPPMFGSLGQLWKHPGLSTMWSKTWHGYNRRWLYVLGWIGIGENILGLTHTGISSHPNLYPSDKITNSSNASGQISPTHPISTSSFSSSSSSSSTSPNLPTRRMSTRLMIENLIKSFLTFLLSGFNHDVGSFALILKNNRPQLGQTTYLTDIFRLTPFFVVQPIGLAVEAFFKTNYRKTKTRFRVFKGKEPNWSVFVERLIGFIWTWTWLGWTARFFVEGMVQLGSYRRDGDRELYWSLFGGLIWGKWYI